MNMDYWARPSWEKVVVEKFHISLKFNINKWN